MEACFMLLRPPVPIPHQRYGGATGWSSGRLVAGYSLLCLSSSRSNFMDSAGIGVPFVDSICGRKKEEGRRAVAPRTVTSRSSPSSSESFYTSPDGDEDPQQETREDDDDVDDDDSCTIPSSEKYGYQVDGPMPPEWLGINPNPPNWPASRHMMFVSGGERQMSDAVGMPLSLRMLKKKRRALMLSCAAEAAQCLSSPSSVKRALSSLLFMIRELHSYTLQLYQHLFYDEDGTGATNAKMQSIIAYVNKEVQASFCWLFHHVFSCTPTLMVSLMLLLANFTVYSMAHSAAAVPPRLLKTAAVVSVSSEETEAGVTTVVLSPEQQEEEEEARAWKRILEEAARMQRETAALMVEDVIPIIVPAVAVEVEPVGMQSEHYRTELMYKKAVEEEPRNPLLLSNYAQFLHVVVHDHGRAEEYYRRAAAIEPVDGEAVCQYAKFLWSVRKDVTAAEEAYLRAIAADPRNSNYAASYAHFLWCTGGDDTCQNSTFSAEGDAAGDVF